jgi:hypothetical protein
MAYGTVVADVVQSSITGVSLGAGNATLLKNRLIDAGFIINQRGYVSNTALSAGTYAHDRWKAGASGCTYTFTQGSAGVPIVITITAGSLQQIIEGCNMPDGGTFTLSWTGTAQGRVNGGGYSTSPLIVTSLTAGANCTVEFNTGTCSFPQLEVGTSATGFEYRQYGQELALCQRYFEKSFEVTTAPANGLYTTGCMSYVCYTDTWVFAGTLISFKIPKRTAPTLTFYGTSGIWQLLDNNNVWQNQGYTGTGAQGQLGTTTIGFNLQVHNNGASGYAVGSSRMIRGDWIASSEL